MTGGGAVTGARDLLDPLLADVSANSTDQVPTLRGVPLLVRAIAGGDADLAAEAALIHQHQGHTGAELAAWEEAAVAAAATGNRDLGRTWARRAIDLADRLAARLRRHGLAVERRRGPWSADQIAAVVARQG